MPPRPKAPDADRYRIEAVDRTLLLLDALAQNPGANPTQLAATLSANRSMVFRILTTLSKRGFAVKDEQNGYHLGPRLLYLGQRVEVGSALIGASRDALDRLLETTRENVHLMVRDDLDMLCLAVRISPQPLRIAADVGTRGSLHTGPVGKVLLAFAPPEILDQVYARHGHEITPDAMRDRDQMEALLLQIRNDGFYATAGEAQREIYTLSAPIRDGNASVVATITIAAPVSRITPESRAQILSELTVATAEVSAHLGYNPGDPA